MVPVGTRNGTGAPTGKIRTGATTTAVPSPSTTRKSPANAPVASAVVARSSDVPVVGLITTDTFDAVVSRVVSIVPRMRCPSTGPLVTVNFATVAAVGE